MRRFPKRPASGSVCLPTSTTLNPGYATLLGRLDLEGGRKPSLRPRLLGITRRNGGLFPRQGGGETDMFVMKQRCAPLLKSGGGWPTATVGHGLPSGLG